MFKIRQYSAVRISLTFLSKKVVQYRLGGMFLVTLSTSMKTSNILIAASALVTSTALAVPPGTQTKTFSGSATTNNSWADINLQKFNMSWGTLTGVKVTINYANLGGSFNVSTAAAAIDVEDASGSVGVRQKSTNNVGFTQVNSGSIAVVTTPATLFTIENGNQTFGVNSTTAISSTDYTIGSGYFSLFESANGSGNVVFQTRNSPIITITGGSYTLDSSLFTVNTSMTVEYTYTAAVPEASTYGIALGGLALAGAIIRRRRQAK